MTSLFSCPLCAHPLEQGPTGLSCQGRHCFDRAREGYVHLLPANRKHSQNPGDDKQMVAARAAFLEKGHYAPLRDALCGLVLERTGPIPSPIILDSGCGEGYYTAGLYEALTQRGQSPRLCGVDISKFALRKAAKRLPQAEFAVASVYHLPLADRSVDVLVNIFSPLAAGEFARVVRPGGHFIYAVPAPRHLWQMKQLLYPQPYENPVKREDYPGFEWQQVRQVRYTAQLDCSQDIMALFHMTPYAWKTPREGVEALSAVPRLAVEIGFDFHHYRHI